MEYVQDYNHTIIKNLHKSVKLCQAEFVNKTEVATEINNTVVVLCKEWESVFLHGIKRRPNKSLFSRKSSNISEIPTNIINQINPFSNQTNPTFWLFLCEFLESEEIMRFTNSLNKVDSEIGRCRAWLRAAINEQTLELLLSKVISNHGQVIAKIYYESHAVLLDHDQNTVLPSMAAGLSSILFSLELNNEHLNHYSDNNRRFSFDSRSQNNSSSSSSFSRPMLFSSSTSGSFEDVEIRETLVKLPDSDQIPKSNAKPKPRVISIAAIEDDDDGKSDSSELYSPFNLLKTGYNLVSKFHFGAEDRLSDIKEQGIPHKSNDSIDGLDNVGGSHLIECGLRECDEMEFHDCCLSLQNEFYSSEREQSSANSDNSSPVTNVAYVSADLVVNSSMVPHSLDLLTELSSNYNRGPGPQKSTDSHLPHIENYEEFDALRRQIEEVNLENKELKSQIESLKVQYDHREEAFRKESAKMLRENELMKKRLKTYIVKAESRSESEMRSVEDEGVSGSKIDQLIQMHTELLELNDQLQRSLVDKDLKLGMLQSKVAKLMYNEEEVGVHVEHFGTLYVSIVDYFLSGCGTKKHLSYRINISCWPMSAVLTRKNDEWHICRRFKEFHRLHVDLTGKYPALRGVPFPSKWLYKANEDQLLERRKGLEAFLRTVVTFLLQQWAKDNRVDNFDAASDVSGMSSSISHASVAQSSSEVVVCNTKKEVKNIITDIIPFLAPNPPSDH